MSQPLADAPPASQPTPEAPAQAAGAPGPFPLPLEAVGERSAQGFGVRMRVRAEHVTVSKAVVVSERVVVRRLVVGDVAHVAGVVRREQLRLETRGRIAELGQAETWADREAPAQEHVAARHGLPWRKGATR